MLPRNAPTKNTLKEQANVAVRRRKPMAPTASGRGNFKGEATYRAFYDDLVLDRGSWTRYFGNGADTMHTSETCATIGKLATIYRQLGAVADCEAVRKPVTLKALRALTDEESKALSQQSGEHEKAYQRSEIRQMVSSSVMAMKQIWGESGAGEEAAMCEEAVMMN